MRPGQIEIAWPHSRHNSQLENTVQCSWEEMGFRLMEHIPAVGLEAFQIAAPLSKKLKNGELRTLCFLVLEEHNASVTLTEKLV